MSWPPRIGELLPRAKDAYGVHEKLADYSLNLEHSDGRHKAVLFETLLDITAADVDYLAGSLIAGIAVTPIDSARDREPFGYVCRVRLPVRGCRARSDRNAIVSTAWHLEFDGAAPRLVTAFIKP